MPFDPERDGWPLRDALMRTSDPAKLAELACACSAMEPNDLRRPRWWLHDQAPQLQCATPAPADPGGAAFTGARALERAFLARLVAGELKAWGRRDSPVARHEHIPPDAWPALGTGMRTHWLWTESRILLETVTGHAPVTRQTRGFLLGTAGERLGRGWVPQVRMEPVRAITLRLFAVRVQLPGGFAAAGKSNSEKQCTAWLVEMMNAHPNEPRPKGELARAAAERFGLGTEAFKRGWAEAVKLSGSAWNKPGPRKSVG